MGASVSALPSDGKYNQNVSVPYPSQNLSAGQTRETRLDTLVVATREKKKKMTGFATLRRKLIRRRRTSKSFDHSKVFRDFIADWSPLELSALVEEYEATAALKDLAVQADLARPPASTYKQDLSDLYDYKYCSDVTLVFQGAFFPAHRAVLSVRCTYFRELLSLPRNMSFGAHVHVDSLQSRGIDIPTFDSLLRYLYTGDFNLSDVNDVARLDLIIRLGQEFGTPNPLEHDLRYLMESGDMADSVLVFASGPDVLQSEAGSSAACSTHSEYGFFPWLEIPCHRAVLCARSPFFRGLIQRRCRLPTAEAGSPVTPTRIVLDESVIPRRFARILMQTLYTDNVDLRSMASQRKSAATQEEAAARVNSSLSAIEEATELFQIGRFLELDILAQGCEDILVDNLCLENLAVLLRWSQLPHGSAWVWRQAMHLLREDFSAVAQASVLLELDKSHLAEALQSDFLQASELEVLQGVLRWGEHQLVRRMEDREPNIVSQTAHSVARKGIRRRDLNDVELREILSELLPYVRMDHVLPPNHEILTQAIRRGLVPTPPSHMIGGEKVDRGDQLQLHAWIRGKNNGLFVKPRLFMPYYEEAKALLSDQLVQEMELVRLRMLRMSSHIPDTLYMIDGSPGVKLRSSDTLTRQDPGAAPDLDVVTGSIPIPDSDTLQSMIRRERKLRMSPLCQKAQALPLASRRDINHQIRLRVVREFNLPDSIAEALESAAYQFAEETEDVRTESSCSVWEPRKPSATRAPAPPKRLASRARQQPQQPPDLPACGKETRPQPQASQLSELIPDIALATAQMSVSSVAQQAATPLQPPEPFRELQLDLGDGVPAARSRYPADTVSTAPPGRLSTFRTDDATADPADTQYQGSPRLQRRARANRAADIRVFI